MTMRQQRTLLAASAAMLQILITGSAFAFCNWEAEAVAGIGQGSAIGEVTSSHYGRLTRVDCVNSRDTSLQHRTLKDGAEVSGDHITGPPATLGAHIGPEEFDFVACSGTWSSTTKMGTTALGVRTWYAQDLSGLWVASCGDDGGGGCGGSPCQDGCEPR